MISSTGTPLPSLVDSILESISNSGITISTTNFDYDLLSRSRSPSLSVFFLLLFFFTLRAHRVGPANADARNLFYSISSGRSAIIYTG